MIDKNFVRDSPISLTFLIAAGVLLLVVVAGMFIFLVGLGKPLMATPVKPEPVPEQWILLVILVLLAIIAVLLLFLLICCYRGKQQPLPRVLATVLHRLKDVVVLIPTAIMKTAEALEHTSVAIGWINDRIKQAGDLLQPLDNAFSGNQVDTDVSVPIPVISTTAQVTVGNVSGALVTGVNIGDFSVNLHTVKDSLTHAHGPLRNQTITVNPVPPDFIGTVPADLGTVKGDLHDAAKLLSKIADDLNAILAVLP